MALVKVAPLSVLALFWSDTESQVDEQATIKEVSNGFTRLLRKLIISYCCDPSLPQSAHDL